MGHRPFYGSASQDASDLCDLCRQSFEPLFLEYGVDIVYSGHVHNTERLSPIANNITDTADLDNPSAPWYLRNGAGGHYDGLDPLVTPLLDNSNFADDVMYSWSRLVFHNCTHVTNEFVSSKDGAVLDAATLFKNRTCGFLATSSLGLGSGIANATSPATPVFAGSGGRASTISYNKVPLMLSLFVIALVA